MKHLTALLLLMASAVLAEEQALVDLSTGEILARRTVEAQPANPAKWVPLTRDSAPAFDSSVEKLTSTTVVAGDKSSVTYGWQVVALTQNELDAKAAAAAEAQAAADREAEIELIMKKLANGTASNAEVQEALYKLLKQFNYSE